MTARHRNSEPGFSATRWASQLWRARFYVPLSPLGALVLLTAVGVNRYLAAAEVDLVLHAASLAAIGLVAFSVVMVLATTIVVRLRLDHDARNSEAVGGQLELESGQVSATGYTFPRLRGWPLVQLSLQWAAPAEVRVTVEREGRARWHEIVAPRRRGRHPTLLRRFIVGDIFGLARFGLPRRAVRSVRIQPARARLSGHVISHVVGGDALSHPDGPAGGELLDMRRYAHGDPLRRVLWKAFARTRQLLVRTPEQAIMPSPSGVGYLVAGPGDEPSASAARFFVEEGLLGEDFLFCADGCSEPTSDVSEALEQIITSGEFHHRGAAGLQRFVERLDERHRRSCVLFLPPRAGRWLERVERLAPRLPGALAVVAVDEELGLAPRGLLSRLLLRGDPTAPERERGQSALPGLVRRLRRAGLELRVIHRPSGKLIPAAQLEALAR